MSKIKLRKLLLGGAIFVCVIFYLFSSHFQTPQVEYVDGNFIQSNINLLTLKLTNWLEGQVLGISYEERFCKHVSKWNKSSKYPPVSIVAEQLNIHDGDHIFVNGLHCGEWLVALKGTFPNIQLFGVDKDQASIDYVSTLVNGTFHVAVPFELDKLQYKPNVDHAIIDGVLSIYSHEYQCQTIRQMIPFVKAGGSIYMGKNFEQCENKAVEKELKELLDVQVLPKCYWSQKCLSGRSDIAEILYSKEGTMMNDEKPSEPSDGGLERKKEELLIDFSSCATSIFIYKHIVLMSNKDLDVPKPDSKYIKYKHDHICTHSETVNSTNQKMMDADKIKQAVKDVQIKGLDIQHK